MLVYRAIALLLVVKFLLKSNNLSLIMADWRDMEIPLRFAISSEW